MQSFRVEVAVLYKKGLRDPESEVIHKDLILKRGYTSVKKVRAGKHLSFEIEAKSRDEALKVAMEICEKLRIYNPVIQEIEVFIRE